MLMRNMCGEEVSALGMGLMRLPMTGSDIDVAATRELLDTLYEGGVNYWDTAYSYLNGASELVVGELLPRYDRNLIKLATKMPGHEIRPDFDPRKIFENQLAKTGAGYFDYYLLHNVCEMSLARYMDKDLDVLGYLLEQKRAGKIRHLGFSCHGALPTLEQFLAFCEDKAPGEVEFVQLQLNYLDWVLQDGAAKYALVQDAGMDVVVMEPLRGGTLARQDGPAGAQVARVAAGCGARSLAEVSFRWLLGLPGVKTVLSGMNAMEQVEDNLRIFAGAEAGGPEPFAQGSEARAAVDALAREMADISPCTACRYCTHECPLDLDIPRLIRVYDDSRFNATMLLGMELDALPAEKRPEACLGCGLCAEVCPQNIAIPELLAELADKMKDVPHWADISAARLAAEKALLGE